MNTGSIPTDSNSPVLEAIPLSTVKKDLHTVFSAVCQEPEKLKNLKWNETLTLSLLEMSETYQLQSLQKICLSLLGIEIVDMKWQFTLDSTLNHLTILKNPFIQSRVTYLKLDSLNSKALETIFSIGSIQVWSLQLNNCECEFMTKEILKTVKQNFPNVQKLILVGKKVDDKCVKRWLKEYQESLVSLDLSNSAITDDIGESIGNKCPNLTYLKMKHCHNLTYKFIKPLKNCKKLTHLNIGYCPNISEQIIKKFIRHDQKYDFNFVSLDISALPLNKDSLDALVKKQEKLTTLNLTDCEKIKTKDVNQIIKTYRNLNTSFSEEADVEDQLMLACCYLKGISVTKDKKEAWKWLQKTMKISNSSGKQKQQPEYLDLKDLDILNEIALNRRAHPILSDDELEKIILQYPDVIYLNLSNYDKITDKGLENISKLSSLISLDLSYCKLITDKELESVSKLSGLTSLNLCGCELITDKGLESVSKLSGLTSLNLTFCKQITDKGLESVSKLFNLTSLNLYNCNLITDKGLENISKLSGLTSLDLSSCNLITDKGLESISKLSGLTSLNLDDCNLTDKGMETISKLANLNSLSLSVESISKLVDLYSLDLSFCNQITDKGLESVNKLANLTKLSLSACPITNKGLENIGKLSILTRLSLSFCRLITDKGLEHLSKLSSLTRLGLDFCNLITDKGLESLSNLSCLTNLSVHECKLITNTEILKQKLPNINISKK